MAISFQELINNASQKNQLRNETKSSDSSISYETIKAVQQLQDRISQLERRHGSLDQKVHALEKAKL